MIFLHLKKINMKFFKSLSRLLPLVVGSAAAGVLASMSPAKALVFNVGGTNYDITTVTGTYTSLSTQLQATPWWGQQQLSIDLATAVYGSLGQEAGSEDFGGLWDSSSGGTATPYFAYAFTDNAVFQGGAFQSSPGGTTFFSHWFEMSPDTDLTFALGSSSPATVPFDIPGGATIPAVGSLLALGAMRKARKSIASKTRIANPVVAVR
jgi:hypothetical protein